MIQQRWTGIACLKNDLLWCWFQNSKYWKRRIDFESTTLDESNDALRSAWFSTQTPEMVDPLNAIKPIAFSSSQWSYMYVVPSLTYRLSPPPYCWSGLNCGGGMGIGGKPGGGWNPPGIGGNWKFGGSPPGGGKGMPLSGGNGGAPGCPGKGGIGIPRPPAVGR